MDQYNINGTFANRCPCGSTRDDAEQVYCQPCRQRANDLYQRARANHFRATLAQRCADMLPGVCRNCYQPHYTWQCPEVVAARNSTNTCLSCGDPAVGEFCITCIQAGEARKAA